MARLWWIESQFSLSRLESICVLIWLVLELLRLTRGILNDSIRVLSIGTETGKICPETVFYLLFDKITWLVKKRNTPNLKSEAIKVEKIWICYKKIEITFFKFDCLPREIVKLSNKTMPTKFGSIPISRSEVIGAESFKFQKTLELFTKNSNHFTSTG